jgi:hypothetical protein
MSEIKITLPRFDGKPDSDYHLWELRLQAILESKNLWHVIEPPSTAVTLSTTTVGTQTTTDGTQTGQISAQTTEPQTADGNQTGTQTGAQTAPAGTGGIVVSAGQGSVSLAEHKRKAAAIIINGLGDKPLRVVASDTKEPKIMVQKLRERYASTKLSTRMSLLAELHNLRYKSGDMGEYVDKYAALLERLTAMAAEIPQELAIIMFLNSMQGKFEAIVAALRTMGDEKLTWNDVTTRMIEEAASSSNSRGSRDHSAMVTKSKATSQCAGCKKTGHTFENCWWNPNNPKNRLSKSEANKSTTTYSTSSSGSKTNSDKEKRSKPSNENTKRESGRSRFKNREKGLTMTVPEDNSYHENDLLLDSGASCHMCQDKSWFKTLNPIPDREIWLGDNSVIHADAEGDIEVLVTDTAGDALKLVITKVLYVPDLGHNLLSCARLASKGIVCKFDKTGCTLVDTQDGDDEFCRATRRNNLYWITNVMPRRNNETASVANAGAVSVWHSRLAHVNKFKISEMIEAGLLEKSPPSINASECIDCNSGKQTRRPFKGSMDKATKAGEIIHSDVVGPFPDSYSGARYFVTFIDEWSRFIVANPICTKGEVLKCFKTFEAHFEKQYEASIKSIHSDNGGEYTPVQQYAEQKGIRVTRAAPYTPQSNGIAERTNRTLVEAVRTTLKQSGLAKEFWAESLANAVTVQNCIPKRNGVSPYEMLNKKCPTYD